MIYKKLLEFQKLGIKVRKDGKNPAFGGSSYPTLNEVLDKVTEPLNKLGVVIIPAPKVIEGIAGLYTKLYDTEDETFVEGFLPFVQKENAQKMGANITYNRRYSLVTMLGLEAEDDDGNEASAKSTGTAEKGDDLDTI